VSEDIANANSTACLAAYLAARDERGVDISVDMGDSLDQPATIMAWATDGHVRVGGRARVGRTIVLP
jgi:predicted PhzF superfamily epimerase YddE/YHI9